MSSWLASSISQPSDPRFNSLVSDQNIFKVNTGLKEMLSQKNNIISEFQDSNTIKQLLMNVFDDLYPNPSITIQQMNQEAINRAYKVMVSKFEMNKYYLGKIGYLPVPPPLPRNMSAFGLKPAGEIYRGI
jgi:hypothetical protein